MSHTLEEILRLIRPVDSTLLSGAQQRLDDLTKPRGSLGRLEEVAARLYQMGGGKTPLCVEPAQLIVAAGDHGVAQEGVSAYPQEVTRQMLANILAGGAASSVLTRTAGMGMRVVDAACKGEPLAAPTDNPDKLLSLRLAQGTGNIATEAAMSEAHCEQALLCGVNAVRHAVVQGVRLVATGEMGIANSTPATALFCAYLGLEPTQVTGPGTGLSPRGVAHKACVVEKALARHADVVGAYAALGPISGPVSGCRADDPTCAHDKTPCSPPLFDPDRAKAAHGVLAALGGYEIAVLAGVVLGAAACSIPVLVDGFISTSAFVAARAIQPHVSDYAFLTHASAEPGYAQITRALAMAPLLHLDMRLGEGTGCAVAYPLIKAATHVFNTMSTFSGANVTGDIQQPV